jgi:glycerol-3-phosphate acyltransferase PlsY
MQITTIITAILSYLLGSVPFGLLIGKLNGVDVRTQGSGNIGATNVFRCVGKAWGVTAFLLDFLKGLSASLLIPLLVNALTDHTCSPTEGLLFGFCAIIGHNWPVFLKFKGGKGIATTGGVLAGVAPLTIGPAFLVWLLVFLTSRYVSLASIAACVSIGVTGFLFYYSKSGWVIPAVLTLLGIMGIWRHRSNIQRLIKGEENRFDLSKRRKKTHDAAEK